MLKNNHCTQTGEAAFHTLPAFPLWVKILPRVCAKGNSQTRGGAELGEHDMRGKVREQIRRFWADFPVSEALNVSWDPEDLLNCDFDENMLNLSYTSLRHLKAVIITSTFPCCPASVGGWSHLHACRLKTNRKYFALFLSGKSAVSQGWPRKN